MSEMILKERARSNAMEISGQISKYKGRSLSKKLSFYLRPLTMKDCSAMEDLSMCIYDNLKEGQECFIHKHDRKYYREIMTQENSDTKFVGVFIGHQLIAMSNFKMVETYASLQEEFPNHKLNIFSKDRRLGEVKVAVLGSDSVHPKFRGNHLNKTMIDYRQKLAGHLGATDVVSIIDRKNVWNMTPYFENEFNMFSSGIDPADNGKIALMHRPLRDNVVRAEGEVETSHFENFNQIDKMFYMNRIGVGYDKESKKIMFARTDYYDKMSARNNNVNLMLMRNTRNGAGL
ncbi:MAG: hypothetical protein PHE89_00925 [Alphaproteobacteria bacterium]|nr:hypothetical protein [Alphaproteobacteria bacterium]